MNTIKLIADYHCWPLWEYEGKDLYDNPHPSTYPLSETTVARLIKWQDTYDAILNQNDPAASSFANAEARQEFEREGINLWQKVRQELAGQYQVVYFSHILRRVVTDLDEVKHLLNRPLAIVA